MDKSQPPRSMSSTSSPQQSQSQPSMNRLTRRQSSMRPSATSPSHSPTPDQDVPGLDFRPEDARSTFTNSSPPYPSPPHGVTHARPPHMIHSSPPFVFHHYLGAPGREASISHMSYAPPSMTSMVRQHAPVYSYQGASTEPTPSLHQTYGAATPTLPVYPRHPVSPSHSLSPRQASTASTGEMQHLTSYPSPHPFLSTRMNSLVKEGWHRRLILRQ